MQTKKGFMVWGLFIGICIDFLYAYFLCVATTYLTAFGDKQPDDAMTVPVPDMPKLW
jgi:hypothetical protein